MSAGLDLSPLVSADAERALLGCMLVDPDAGALAEGVVSAEDFHDEGRRAVFEAVAELGRERVRVDALTVRERLQAKGVLETAGGADGVMLLMSAAPDFTHAADYATMVRKLGTLRRLVLAAARIAREAYESRAVDLGETLEKARRLVEGVGQAEHGDGVLLWLDSLSNFLEGQWERLAELDAVEKGGKRPYLELPWGGFRRYGARLRAGTLAVVAASSGVGKTVFLECCAEVWARQGVRVAFFHLELSHRLMLDRRTARLTGIPLSDIEDGAVNPEIDKANEALRHYPGGVTYVHCPGWSPARVAVAAERLHGQGLCDVLLLDYLQKLRLPRSYGQNKADDIGDAVETFKTLAERLGIPAVLASQFNRGAEGAERKTKGLIRGSGEVEEKANLVVTLDRKILTSAQADGRGRLVGMAGDLSGEVTVRVDKNSGGPTGDLFLWLDGPRFALGDVTAEQEPQGQRDDMDF